MVLNGTSITASIRSSSGRSVSGNEESFLIKPSQVLNLDENNYFKSRNDNEKMMAYSAMFSLNYYKGFSVFRSFSLDETATIVCNMAYKLEKEL